MNAVQAIVPGCPFCYANGKLEVVAHYPQEASPQNAVAYLVLAKASPNGDDYLAIPASHAESESELPDDFTAACKSLRMSIPWMNEAAAEPWKPGGAGYHTGTNFGLAAGQTVRHLHQWYSRVPAGYFVPGIATHTRNALS